MWDSMNGIVTEEVFVVDDGRNKSYQVNCTSKHATAFAVLTTVSDVGNSTEVCAVSIYVHV